LDEWNQQGVRPMSLVLVVVEVQRSIIGAGHVLMLRGWCVNEVKVDTDLVVGSAWEQKCDDDWKLESKTLQIIDMLPILVP
jgi:hypothetical protein